MVINDNEDGRVKDLQQTEAARRRAQASGSGGAFETHRYLLIQHLHTPEGTERFTCVWLPGYVCGSRRVAVGSRTEADPGYDYASRRWTTPPSLGNRRESCVTSSLGQIPTE